jgi:ferredoxin
MAPEFFAYDEETDRIVMLHDQASENDVHEAVRICPKECISLEP